MGTKIPVRPRAQFSIIVSLAVGADERRQFRLGQHPMLHLPGDGDGTVCPHEPSQYRVKIGAPIVRGLTLASEGTGKLGVGKPVDTGVAKARNAECFGRVRTLRPAREFPEQQEFSDSGLVGEQLFVACLPHALNPV